MVRLSFAPIPKFDDRFARQNRYEPPPEFPLASPYSSIVHHLSGPNMYAPTQTKGLPEDAGRRMVRDRVQTDPPTTLTFIARTGFNTHALAHMLDSLVRVSRRGKGKHFDRAGGHKCPDLGPARDTTQTFQMQAPYLRLCQIPRTENPP